MGTSGALISNLGHGDERIAQTYFEQAKRVEFVHGTQFSSSPVKEVARCLADVRLAISTGCIRVRGI
jgi:adenosylmethionine-8-amino-7-oxononanoate aminotransferase